MSRTWATTVTEVLKAEDHVHGTSIHQDSETKGGIGRNLAMPDLGVHVAYNVKSASPVNHPHLYVHVAEDGSGVSHAKSTESA